MHNPFQQVLLNLTSELSRAKQLKAFGSKSVVESPHKVLLFSPHPDDECITGLLPLRFQRELGCQIINIPMTFGSKKSRREGRKQELEKACSYLGWQNHIVHPSLESVGEGDVISLLRDYQPVAIFFPHEQDWNSRHVEVHHIIAQALLKMPESFQTILVETEFWGAMSDPNLHVEGATGLVADLIAATSQHEEEVARNPYHLRLPGWMQDNVRRGAELVGGQGGTAPDFVFSTLYRMRQWGGSKCSYLFSGGREIPAGGGNLIPYATWK